MAVNVLHYQAHPIKFRGEIRSCEVVEVSIDDIFYRPNNHRIQCAMKEFIAKSNGRYTEKMLKADIRRKEVQKMVSDVLMQSLGEDSVRLEEKLKKERQTIPLYLTEGNIVVNGNSRLYLMKKLYHSNPEGYKHFEKIRCVYLPEDATEEEIDSFEIQEQMEEDVKVEYVWYEKANWINEYKKINKASDDVLSKKFKMPKSDVKKALASYEEAVLFLNTIGKPHQFKLIEREKAAFETLSEIKQKFAGDPARQKLLEKICYWYLNLKPTVRPERLYMYFKKIASHIEEIEDALLEFGPVKENNLSITDEINEDDDINKLFGDMDFEKDTEKILKTVDCFDQTKQDQTRTIIDRVVEIEEMKAKDQEKKRVPEMELKQALVHIETSFAHFTEENKKTVRPYLLRGMKLFEEYLKKAE